METNNPQNHDDPTPIITELNCNELDEETFSLEVEGGRLLFIVERPLSDDEIEDIVGTISKAE